MDLNRAIIVGRATVAPQLRSTQSGQSVCAIGIATNRVWTDKAGQKQEEVEFHNVVFWGRQAEIASQFLVKGALLLVEGRLKTREWEDKQGQKRRTTEIIAERLQLGPKPQGATSAPVKTSKPQEIPLEEEVPVLNLEEEGEIKPEDIPF